MQPLISPEDLQPLVGSPQLVVLDVRWRLLGPPGREDYAAGHVPGAVFVDLDTSLAAPPDQHGRHPLPVAGDFERVMRSSGVSSDSRVVCYDLSDGTAAARAWWLLRYFGQRFVQVLDGGYAGWVASGGSVTRVVPNVAKGAFSADPGHLPLVDAVGAATTGATGVLLDARAEERYTGKTEPVDPVAGHIPGAVSAPTVDNVDASGRFLPVDVLQKRFAELGVRVGGDVATYCGSGVTAAHQILALELAGIQAALYADSWSGWIADPTRPVATGWEPSTPQPMPRHGYSSG
ncbi:MAG: sulfurtransferase [Nocardioidaceae bacterium]